MMVRYELMGDLAGGPASAELDEDWSPVEVCTRLGLGLRDGRRLLAVQIGGVLGPLAFGTQLAEPLSASLDTISSRHLLFIGDLFCPVDYLRFLSRFLVRELRIDSSATRALNDWIEAMTQRRSSAEALASMERVLGDLGSTVAERRVAGLARQLVKRFPDVFDEHARLGRCRSGICRTLIKAQCVNACPAGVHVPGYVALMKAGRTKEAYALMRKTNPLSLVCGRICARPCETRCRRGELEQTVGVRALQRYASERALVEGSWTEDALPRNGKSVGVVGSGPAGLTAAYFLQRTGYDVTVYEAAATVGGMLRSCVPEYRMPSADLEREIATIESLGVVLRRNCKIGSDLSFETVQAAHDAIIVATGAGVGVTLPGLEGPGTETALEFLASVRLAGRRAIGRRVVVVGGGDVAMDAARTAIRLGAESVTVVSLEDYDRMPANREDRDLAAAEGVCFISGYGVAARTTGAAGAIGLALRRCAAVLDLEGRFAPVFSAGDDSAIETDSLILAVGQRPDPGFSLPGLELARGFVPSEALSGRTSLAGVYAAGDAVAIGAAVSAIAMGRAAAESVDRDLGGVGLYTGADIAIPEERLSPTTWDDPARAEPSRRPARLAGDFSELGPAYRETDALYEASRCMRCDLNSTQPLWLRPRA